jgi:hypothetical protein
MENKYFTPNIEDLCIGYELEIRQANKWLSHKIQSNDCFCDFIDMDGYRVPYLNKEQIEAEGWTSFITEYERDIVTEKMIYTFFKEDRNYMLGWNFNTNKITLIIKDPSLVLDYYTEPTFRGECKDINTFRKIIKLLKI